MLPALTVGFVALSLFGAGAPRPFASARVLGGPTDGRWLGLRVEVVEVIEGPGGQAVERALPGGRVGLGLKAGGFEARRVLALDEEGGGELGVEVPPDPRPFDVVVEREGEELARGRIELSAERWARAARRRGGWFTAEVDGTEVRVAPLRGALAVPFRETLVVELRRGDAGLSGLRLSAASTGGRIDPKEAVTDHGGRALFELAPEEHTLGLELSFEYQGRPQRARVALPVVPGALRARLESDRVLVIESPVPRDVAYFALVTEQTRLLGGRVELAAGPGLGATARVTLPVLPRDPRYAVVASARDLRSPGAVGWPLAVPGSAEPASTFDAVDALLLDGRARGSERERVRRARVRWSAAAVCAVAVLLELVLLLSYTRARDRTLEAHLARQGVAGDDQARLAPVRSFWLVTAVAMIALGFLMLAVIALLKLR